MLRSSPCLRNLNISFHHATATVVCSAPLDHHAFLPHLQELRLASGVSSNIDFILGRLKFPADKVRFAISCEDRCDSEILLRFLSQRRLPLLSTSLDRMAISLYENIDLSYPRSSHLPESSVLSISYGFNAREVLPSLRTLKLSEITHMSLEMIPSGSAVFKRIIPLLENLLHLRVIHEHWDKDDHAFDHCLIPGSSFLKALTLPRLQKSTPQSSVQSQSTPADIGSGNETTNQKSVYPCPSLRTLEIVFVAEPHLEQFVERYFEKLAQCCKLRGQIGLPIECVSIFCEPPILAENMKAWLQANEFDWSRVEFQTFTSKARKARK